MAAVTERIVVIGTSLGGLTALDRLLSRLPVEFPVPVVIVQHRSKNADRGMQTILQRRCTLPIVEADDKMPLEPGRVYLAPPDYHLLIEGRELILSTDEPVNAARPSVDVLFEAAAEAYGAGVLAVILTGLNHDGASGARRVKERGGTVLVQDPASAEAPSMPLGAIAAAAVDRVLPLDALPGALVEFCGDGMRRGESGGRLREI